MRTTRRLALHRETLSDLSAGELDAVVGGSHGCPTGDACETITHGPSLDQPCPTVPVLVCARTLNPLSCAVC